MPHSQFLFRQKSARELEKFPHIVEFALRKNSTIQLDSFVVTSTDYWRIYCVIDGRFEWIINGRKQVLYPGNLVLILPGQEIGGSKGYLDIGTFYSLHFNVKKMATDKSMNFGEWSSINENERQAIGKILLLNALPVLKMKEIPGIFQQMRLELRNQEMGYQTRFNQMLDSLLICIARCSTLQETSFRDFPKTFTKLEQQLRKNLAHQWTVEEMAATMGLGTTAFTEKVKSFTGFSPLNYLINIRISEAIRLLKRPDVKVTEIALATGFYSSQHFSTTFKKLTGHTPGQFRKKNTPGTKDTK